MPLLDIFWTTLWIFLLFAWFWVLISVFGDLFRSDDLSGWGKALWTLFVIVLPWLGVLVYLVVRGQAMNERRMQDVVAREQAQQEYIRTVTASSGASAADEIAKLAELRSSGVLTEQEFDAQKAKLLASA